MAVTSFDVNERTAHLLAHLQATFGVKTNAALNPPSVGPGERR